MSKITIRSQRLSGVEPTKEEWQSWQGQTSGKFFIAMIEERIKDIQDDFINGDFTRASIEETAQKNAEAIGMAQAFAEVIITLEELKDGSSEDEAEEGETTR